MTEEFIQQLRNELYSGKFCQSDFEKYDVASLQTSTEPFFWMCREQGTSLVFVGAASINEMLSTEAKRIQIFRDNHAPIGAFTYFANYKNVKYFYYDGFKLAKISVYELVSIWEHLICDSLQKAEDEYIEEYQVCDLQLDVKFASDEDEKYYLETLEKADELADDSLARCVKRLTEWARCAVDHYIRICKDYVDNSFYFTEVINDEPRVCGGIIADMDKTDNRWTIHT